MRRRGRLEGAYISFDTKSTASMENTLMHIRLVRAEDLQSDIDMRSGGIENLINHPNAPKDMAKAAGDSAAFAAGSEKNEEGSYLQTMF